MTNKLTKILIRFSRLTLFNFLILVLLMQDNGNGMIVCSNQVHDDPHGPYFLQLLDAACKSHNPLMVPNRWVTCEDDPRNICARRNEGACTLKCLCPKAQNCNNTKCCKENEYCALKTGLVCEPYPQCADVQKLCQAPYTQNSRDPCSLYYSVKGGEGPQERCGDLFMPIHLSQNKNKDCSSFVQQLKKEKLCN